MFFSIHYDEIGIKGQNRHTFEDALITNIRMMIPFAKIEKLHDRILLNIENENKKDEAIDCIKKTFGISWFSQSAKIEPDVKKIAAHIIDRIKMSNEPEKNSFGIFCKRSDKKFPIKSQDFAKEVGSMVCKEMRIVVNLEIPDLPVYIDILEGFVLVYFEKIKCLGGLPVGVSGRVLCLLSGGIDSPVAALLMMKRGCIVDFVHIYSQKNIDEVEKSKIFKLIKILDQYQRRKSIIYLVPYQEFYLATLKKESRYELILFKRFIVKIAEKLITNQLGIVSGDSLAQVASQTIENLFVTGRATDYPVYRPLLTYDKREIIELARKFGTYEVSIEEYKDCCSIVSSRHPNTRAKEEEVKKAEGELEINQVIEKTLSTIEQRKI